MARKKSETPQGDGAPGPTPEPKDEAAGIDRSEATSPPESPAATESGSAPERVPRPEPWDPEILPPEPGPAPETTRETAPEPFPELDAEPNAEPTPGSTSEPTAGPTADLTPPSLAAPATHGDPDRAITEAADDPAIDVVAEREEAVRQPEPEREPEPEPAVEPVPVIESVEEPHEDVHEEEPGRSLAARALVVLCLLLAGAGLGIWAAPKIAPMLPSGMAPVANWLTPGQGETTAEIAALRERVDTGLGSLESRVATLPGTADVDTRIGAAVGAAEAKLSAEIEAAKAAAGEVELTDVNQRLAALEAAVESRTTELASLRNQIAGTAGQLSQDALGRIDAYKGEVEALRGEIGAVRDAVSGFSTRLDEVESRASREIDTAQAKVAEIREQADTELSAAGVAAGLARVRAAIAGGQPFAEPLAALTEQGTPPPEGLSAAAESGVATLASLRESYPDAAHAAIRASIMAGAGTGVFARSKAFLEAQVSSRSLTPGTGQGTDAVLSRMEDKLRQDDLDGVLAEAEGLPSEASAAMGDWLAAVRKRAEAVDGLATLDASLTKTN